MVIVTFRSGTARLAHYARRVGDEYVIRFLAAEAEAHYAAEFVVDVAAYDEEI